jgi:hypothetical protein
MAFKGIFSTGIIFIISSSLFCQEIIDSSFALQSQKVRSIYGFVRGGFYGNINSKADKPLISSGYSDLSLRFDYSERNKFKGFADIRLRYGAEFSKPVSYINIREAYAEYSIKNLSITAGQKILKWGRADFTNPTSKFNPQNYVFRSFDREDMDMGNLIASAKWSPVKSISLQAVFSPFYRPSVLIIDPVKLPEDVTINQIQDLVIGEGIISYGLKTDIHLKGIDFGASWFEGYDPMPGIALTKLTIDLSGAIPVISTGLTVTPYKTRVIGADFESSIGPVGLRGEVAWSVPLLSFSDKEFVPLPEVKYAAGVDYPIGSFRLTGEYSGKIVTDYFASPADPILGTEPDYGKLAALMSTPGFDIHEYVREEVGAFNRLYNYQLEKVYHSAGLRIEADMVYGKLLPSVFTMYNFTSHDLLVIPEIRIKPADGITVIAGAEVYSGKKGSLFDIVNDFMSTVYFGLKIDF